MAYDHELHRFDQLAYQSTERLALIYKNIELGLSAELLSNSYHPIQNRQSSRGTRYSSSRISSSQM